MWHSKSTQHTIYIDRHEWGDHLKYIKGKGYGVWHHFQQCFSYRYVVVVSFIGGGNLRTMRKRLTTDLLQVIKHINEDIKETKVYSMRLYSEEYSVDSNIYTFFSRIVCGRRVRVEHAVPYDEHRKDKSSKRRKPNYR